MTRYTAVRVASDLTPEILGAAEHVFDGWYADEARIDWEDFVDRLDGMTLEDGTKLDMGESLVSPGVKAIKAHIRQYWSAG